MIVISRYCVFIFVHVILVKNGLKPFARFISIHNADCPSPDNSFVENRIKKGPGDSNTRDFTYFMLGNTRFIYASAARLVLMKVTN